MDNLPQELVELILLWAVRMSPSEKNKITPLRRVCKAFDSALRPHVFRTLQVEFSKFLKQGAPEIPSLKGVGELCQAIYLDMMVVRDEGTPRYTAIHMYSFTNASAEEISRLSEVFQGISNKVPEMAELIHALRKYCMDERTFDETDFTRVMETVLARVPNLTRLRVNLPFQVVGRTSSTSTLLLANILACVANRYEEECRPLEVLVIDHLSDTTVTNLCNNHRDVANAVTSFMGLKHLVLSIKRQEARNSRQTTFTQQLWYLIRKATVLESLCLIGWNIKRNVALRRHRHSVGFNGMCFTLKSSVTADTARLDDAFIALSIRSCLTSPTSAMSRVYGFTPSQSVVLISSAVKRVDVDPHALIELIRDNSASLRELYLNEVYIKVFGHDQRELTPLWIGHTHFPKPETGFWVADELRNMDSLQLELLRVTGLGYDDFEPDRHSPFPNYDLTDPSGMEISFDQRFVEAVLHPPPEKMIPPLQFSESPQSPASSHSRSMSLPTIPSMLSEPLTSSPPPTILQSYPREPVTYDVEVFQRFHNTTSHFKSRIDGYFTNHNEQALQELQRIIKVADHGMALISAEIDRTHAAEITADGNMQIP
jgi:hypothetical protein